MWCLALLARCPKGEPLTSPETPPLCLHPALGGLRGEDVPPRPALRGGSWGPRRCTQPAAGHLRVGYRYNPLLACLEAWALGSGTSARILSRGLGSKGGELGVLAQRVLPLVTGGLIQGPTPLFGEGEVSLADKSMGFFSSLKKPAAVKNWFKSGGQR